MYDKNFTYEYVDSLSNNEVNSLLKSFECCGYSKKKRTSKYRKECNSHD